MSKVTVIPRSEDLLNSILSRIDGDSSDLSRTLVVFPGQRPAHFLRKALGKRRQTAFIPPRILSYDDFAEYLWREKLGRSSRAIEPIDAAAILFEVHSAVDERFGAQEFVALERFFPVGLQLFDELEELHLANLSVAEIRTGISGLTYGNLHRVAVYYENFYEELEKRNLRTRASSLRTVARTIDTIELGEFDQVIMAGFYALTAVDQLMFRSLAARDQTVMLFHEGRSLAKHLARIGISWEPPEATESGTPSRIRLCKASDTHGQVFALAHALEQQMSSGLPVDEQTAIVLPSTGALLPVLHHVLPMLEPEQYNISLRYPIARTPAYGFLARLLAVVASIQDGRIVLADYVKFLLHPYTKSIRFGTRTDVTRILMHTIEDRLRRKRSGASMTLDELEGESGFFQHAVRALSAEAPEVTASQLAEHLRWIHNNTLRRYESFTSLDDFARQSMDVLVFIHEHSTADSHPLFRPYVDRLIDILRTCSTSLLATQSLGDVRAYQRFLREYVGTSDVPFPGTPLRGLQVLGLLETRNLRFNRVFVLDTSDDVVPGSRSEGMLLPQKLREKLGLQTSADRETLIEYYFDLLGGGAEEVTYFFSENGKKERSRFLQKLIWEREKREGKPDDGRFVASVQYAVRLANPKPPPIGKTPEILERLKSLEYSASALDRYLACPIKFYYADVLGLDKRGLIDTEPDPGEIGTIVHEVLMTLYRTLDDRPLRPSDFTTAQLQRAMEQVFREYFGASVPGKVQLIRRQVESQLGRFLKEYQIPIIEKEPVTILGLEQWVTGTNAGYVFAGKIDRIERRSAQTVILDYKTGRDEKRLAIKPEKLDLGNPDSWPEAVGSVQLPMYWMLYHVVQGEAVERIRPAYIFLGKRNFRDGIEFGLPTNETSARELYTLLESFLLRLVEQIGDPTQEFNAPRDVPAACPNCPYQAICGTQWVSGHDRW